MVSDPTGLRQLRALLSSEPLARKDGFSGLLPAFCWVFLLWGEPKFCPFYPIYFWGFTF